MRVVELKSNLHELIDKMENSKLLQTLYEILSAHKNTKEGSLWKSLSKGQQEEILRAFEESKNSKNLIPHSQIKRDFE